MKTKATFNAQVKPTDMDFKMAYRNKMKMFMHLCTAIALFLVSTSAFAWPISGGGEGDDQANDLVVAPSGNIYAVGTYKGLAEFGFETLNSRGGEDVVVAKISPSGSVLWAVSAGGSYDDQGLAIAVDASENVYITGSFYQEITFAGTTLAGLPGTDIFVAKFDFEGRFKWAQQAGGSHGYDRGLAIEVTDGDSGTLPPTPASVFIAGHYQCDMEFPGLDSEYKKIPTDHCAGSAQDLFVARLNADNGAWIWANGLDEDKDTGSDDVIAMAVENVTGRLYLVGEYPKGGETELLNEDFSSGLGAFASNGSSRRYGINSAWDNDEALFTREGYMSVASDELDAAGASKITLDYAVKRGWDYSEFSRLPITSKKNSYPSNPQNTNEQCENIASWRIWVFDWFNSYYQYYIHWECYNIYSEKPDGSAESLYVEYWSSSDKWEVLERISGSGGAGEEFSRQHELPEDAAHNGLRIRFKQTSGSGRLLDYWHIDDVKVVKVGAKVPFVARMTNTLSESPSFAKFEELPASLQPRDLALNRNSSVTQVNMVGSSSGDYYLDRGECPVVATSGGVFVAGLDDDSLLCRWNKNLSGGVGSGVTSDRDGNVYFTGTFSDTLGTPDGMDNLFSSSAFSDVFVAKLANNNGILEWNLDNSWVTGGGDYDEEDGIPGRAGGLEADAALAIGSDGSSNLYVTGFFAGMSIFGESDSVSSNGMNDLYIANLGTNGNWFQIGAWIVGEAVQPPADAITDQAIYKPWIYANGERLSEEEANELFYWAPPAGGSGQLFPITAMPQVEIYWRTDPDMSISPNGGPSIGAVRWPVDACIESEDTGCYQIHIAGSPVEIEPEDGSYSFLAAKISNLGGSDASVTSGQFTATQAGFSVLIYAAGPSPDPTAYPATIEVVRSIRYDAAPQYTRGVPWEIGRQIVEPSHQELGRTGYVVNENAFYDGAGSAAAYDRQARTGHIIPVNRFEPRREQDAGKQLVVAWYQKNRKGVYWPVKPIEYEPFWPLDPEKIVIASELGAEVLGQEPLDPLVYQSLSIYKQDDPNQPGYNPNDEHALMAPSSVGTGFTSVFALRSDFGSSLEGDLTAASDPYVLVKYFDPARQQWSFRIYEVVAAGAGYDEFRYSGVAGTTVSPPYPVRLLPNCIETSVMGQASSDPQPPPPFFQDYSGQLWAKSASRAQDLGDVLYHYPLQAGFFYDTNNDGEQEQTEGECVPWLARLAESGGGTSSPQKPVKVHYDIVWPSEAPQLIVGETLLEPKRGLPDIANQAAVEVVFDELHESLAVPLPSEALAQLIDPLNPRSVKLDAIPDGVATDWATGGKKVILGTADGTVKIPVSLRNRLSYDPLNKKLILQGVFDDSGAGEPLLLLNVISKLNRVLLKQLDDNSDGSEEGGFTGDCQTLDSNCSWDQAIEALFRKSRNPQGILLVCQSSKLLESGLRECTADREVTADDVLIGLQDTNGDGILEPFQAVGVSAALTAGSAKGTGYMTLAFNNSPALAPLPISLNIIKVDFLQSPPPPTLPAEADVCSTYQGQINIITPENVFDEQLVMRHSGDFGGRGDELDFEWYFHPDTDGTPPSVLPDPEGGELNGWLKFPTGDPKGALEVSIEGANIQTLSDNWFIARYRGLPSCKERDNPGALEWSLWAGQPGATPLNQRAQLAEGWVKRVLKRLNPFEARVQDFAQAATSNYASMLVQLGERYEGDIALNNDPDNLNNMGLIEAYQTVMRRAMALSIGSTPPVNYEPANNAILLIASRLADFYTLLGNEAYADAQDPTVGITRQSGTFGFDSLAPTIFNFQNQLSSVLEEELVLLRGRDDSQGPVAASPVYNRLFWNFTTGDGEVAYQNSYDITDQDANGVVDEFDARILHPQGHGDAWGSYLTAIDFYYDLLKHPFYSWNPRAEAMIVAGTPISVDFEDERQFAVIAASKARAGSEIVDLTYRQSYVDDPAGQWQGYKDTEDERAWGLAEWGSRAGQGAYFDWVTGNAILQSEDPDPSHHGIQKVDRTTVEELNEVIAHYESVQAQVDEADKGLNPLGLAKGVVTFDIDPSLIDAGETHFEQVYSRATTAVENAVDVWDFANTLSRMLRLNQDSIDDLHGNAVATEVDFKNRLIGIFGYPYDDDIGVGGLYPAGYDGPDLYHYMMVDVPMLAGTSLDIDNANDPLLPGNVRTFTGGFSPLESGVNYFALESDPADDSGYLKLSSDCIADPQDFGCSLGEPPEADMSVSNTIIETKLTGFMFTKDASWTGQRRAPGRLQEVLGQMVQARVSMEQAAREYDNLTQDILDQVNTMKATFNINEAQLNIAHHERNVLNGFRVASQIMTNGAIVARRAGALIDNSFKTAAECVPKSIIIGTAGGGDTLSAVRCSMKAGGKSAGYILDTVADGLDIANNIASAVGEDVPAAQAIRSQLNDSRMDLYNLKGDLDMLLRKEPLARSEIYARAEALTQLHGQFYAALAEGQRTLEELITFRKTGAAVVQEYRYEDMAFRIFRNDALQKYRSAFDMAARYVYLAATAYDYETNLLGTNAQAGQEFLTQIVRERSLGQILDGAAVAGSPGLADPMARMEHNFSVLKGQMGFNNPQTETNRFSLRSELFRIFDEPESDERWQSILQENRVDNLWDVPEFRRYARPFAPESAGAQPGIVIRFPTTINFGLNLFGWELGPGDSAYDSSHFATKVRGVGVWLDNYNMLPLSNTPRVYLFPVGTDVLRSPAADNFQTRQWSVVDQVIPVPYPVGSQDLEDVNWTPRTDTLIGSSTDIRRFSSFRAHHYSEPFNDSEVVTDSRLIGRSVWNREWMLVIPGGTFLYDPEEGLDTFVFGQKIPGDENQRDGNGVKDISLFFKTYSYSGN